MNKQPEFNNVLVVTNSHNLTAAVYVCGTINLVMGVEGYRLVCNIPGPQHMVEKFVEEVCTRASEYACKIVVSRKTSIQQHKPYAICHETVIALTANR